ncbi:uncharacterized protein TNCV_3533141 [Trichonephila clavipes]|nr:uncharacterized protein TNCV_3533141 [Trichonephila clavipes]
MTIEELQEILNEKRQETLRNVSPSEQEEDERGPMLTSAIKDLLKKWEAVRAKWKGGDARKVCRSSTSCRWCDVEVWTGGGELPCDLTMAQNYEVRRQKLSSS